MTNDKQMLIDYVKHKCDSGGEIYLDTYDADFLIGTIMMWLEAHNAVLTYKGVVKL